MAYFEKILLLIILLGHAAFLQSETIQIGNGTLLNQCLPIEPMMCYSYSQSIYSSTEIGFGGNVTALGFQYRITSSTFLNNANQFSIYMGVVNRTGFYSLTDWVPLDSLELVFQGNLQQQWFSTSLPGQGWVVIPLNNAYVFSETGNLIIAIDENAPGNGNMGDDFYCSACDYPQSIEVHSMSVNPDPSSPPAAYNYNPFNPLSVRPNLKLEIQPVILMPHSPTPTNTATDVALDISLAWQSNATSWDVFFAPVNQPLQAVAITQTSQNWTPPANLNLLTSYQWRVVAHNGSDTFSGPIWTFTTMGEVLSAPRNLQVITIGQAVRLNWQPPELGSIISYRIFRNQQALSETQDTTYYDITVAPNQTYLYYIVAVNYLNQISPPTNSLSVTIPGSLPVWQMSFDDQPDFALSIPGWTQYDIDNSATWLWNNNSFPHEGIAMSWIVFNPAQTLPPVTEVTAHNGQKMLLCMDSVNPPNNDWLISPHLNILNGYELSFWVRSFSADYGLERLRFLISNTDSLFTSFQALSTEPWISVPAQWTRYTYNLSAFAGQHIYLAWRCVSWDAFALCLDDIIITQSTDNVDDVQTPIPDFRIYPNPAKDRFTIESKNNKPFEVGIYNIKGQRIFQSKPVKTFKYKDTLPAGLYFIRIKQNNTHITRRIAVY